MKKAALFLTSLVSLSLLLSACQPEDKDLAGDPAVAERCRNCKIKGKPETKQNGAAKGPGFYALSAIMVEKEVEAVQMVRLALGLDDASTAGYAADFKRDLGTVTLVSDTKPLQYTTEQGGFKTTVRKTLTASVPVAPVDGVLVDLVGGDFMQTADRLEQKQYINWSEDSYTVKLQELKGRSDELVLSLVTAGTFKTAAGLVPYGLGIVMRLEKASLQSGTVKVLEAKNRLAYMYKPGAKETVIELAGTNHEIVNNGQCYSLSSESVILTDKTKKKLVYKDSAAEVSDSSYKTSAADCASRPTVDLSRAFVY
jgi:hypothetical protein